MKFSTIAAASVAFFAVAQADILQINNPTVGTVWTAGDSVFIGWTGNCASMGNASHAVDIYLNQGPSTATRYVTTLGQLDCSGSNIRANLNLSSTIADGDYSIAVLTTPTYSYTNVFHINALGGAPAATTSAPAPAATTTKASGASSVTANVLAAAGVVAVAALNLVL